MIASFHETVEVPLREGSALADGAGAGWTRACRLADIMRDTGVCALIGGQQIAIFRVGARGAFPEGSDDQVYALGNFDPFSKAMVLSRGIVGDRGGTPKVASPIYKQNFDLRTGQCLDDPAVKIPVYPARVRAGVVEIALRASGAGVGADQQNGKSQ